MAGSANEADFDASYIAGLLDAIGRIRFDISESSDETYTVRPMLRIMPRGTQIREAVIGEFLESQGYRYDFIERGYGEQFFRLQQRADLADLQSYLEGESAQLVRELEFVNGAFADEFDYDILDPKEIYTFLLARDELRHGWRPQGRYHIPPEDITEGHEFSSQDINPPTLPIGHFRTDYSVEWIAGVFDGLCRYRPSIAKNDDYSNGFAMYPTARVHRAGVHEKFVNHFQRFCTDYNLDFGDSSSTNELHVVFTGSANLRRVLDVLFPRLLVLAEHSAAMVEDILPRFDEEAHRDKQGFYELLRDFDPIARASGGPFKGRDYDPDYFADIWREDLDLTRTDPPASDRREDDLPARTELLQELQSVSLSPEDFGEEFGRYQSVVDRQLRDTELSQAIRAQYDDRCQLCGDRLASGDGTGYAEVHHIKPLGEPHSGSDDPENMLVVCPTHHADLDNGVIRIDTKDHSVEHPYDSSVDGEVVSTSEDHALSAEALEYHNKKIRKLRGSGPHPEST